MESGELNLHSSTTRNDKYTHYQLDNVWIGWLDEYPDHKTQGYSLNELKENLQAVYEDIIALESIGILHAR